VKKLIEIEIKNISNLFSETFWQNKHKFMLSILESEREEPSLDNMFDDIFADIEEGLTNASKSLYDTIWDTISKHDKFELFEGDINQFYFWVDGLNKDAFNDYYGQLLEGYTLMEIIEKDLKKTTTKYKDFIDEQIETLYTQHSKGGAVTVFQTKEHIIVSSTNKKNLNDTKESLFMAGYIVYHSRSKKMDDKILHSYVYSLIENSSSLPICLS
jgi:uncharacterized protein YheU (UPF0270 family)